MRHKTKIILLLVVCFFQMAAIAKPITLFPCRSYPICEDLYDRYPYSLMYYYGITASNALAQIVRGDIRRWPENIHSIEVAKTLSKCNVVRQFFYPIVGVVEIAVVLTGREGHNEPMIYEIDPFIGFRWANFPWNHYITTSFLLGEGISYTTSIPWLERRNPNNNAKRLLNYMRVELTLALPSYPRLQLVPLIHHRSGVYGLYGAGNNGSNDICLGLKYLFD